MTFRNVQVEPAFVSHEKYRKSIESRHKSLNDCCFSISNIALIVASIISLIFLVKFLYDDSLYENGEHLLSLRFYRQLVAIIVFIPLVLLVPLFNAISAFFLTNQFKIEMETTLPGIRLIFEAILAILIFVSIIFVAPYIRHGSIASQLDYEFRRHMKRRYDNDFSEVFLDTIQEEYECCDTPFYLANYPEVTPTSCFRKDGLYNSMYERTCGDVLASLVSIRCSIIAACLVVILIALASLIGIDLIDFLRYPNQQYNVGLREARLSQEPEDDFEKMSTSLRRQRETGSKLADECSINSLSSRLDQNNGELERKIPLLAARAQLKPHHRSPDGRNHSDEDFDNDDDDDDSDSDFDVIKSIDKEDIKNCSLTTKQPATTPILTRASYIYNRAQSPVFVNNSVSKSTQSHNNSSSSLNQAEPKSVLKKSSSFQRVDNYDNDENGNEMEEYQKQMQREVQTRRSLLNVRFAE